MLIGYDASRANRHQRSGIENYALHMLLALAEQASEMQYRVYIDSDPIPELAHLPKRFELVQVPLPGWWRPFHEWLKLPPLWTQLALASELKQRPVDCLFVPGHVIPWRYHGRAVSVVHDLAFRAVPEAYTTTQRLWQNLALKHNLRRSQKVVTVSEATKADLLTLDPGLESRLQRIHLGAQLLVIPPEDKITLEALLSSLQLRKPYFLYVGNLQPKKNLETLLAGFADLKRRRLKQHSAVQASTPMPEDFTQSAEQARGFRFGVQLAVVGRGRLDYKDSLVRLARSLGVGDDVLWLDFQPDEVVARLMRAAAAYVQPSWYEGFGMPVVEAQSLGTPAVVSDRGSLPEVAADPELVYPADQPGELAERLARVLEGKLAQSAAQRQAFVQRFDWAQAAQQLEKIWVDLA